MPEYNNTLKEASADKELDVMRLLWIARADVRANDDTKMVGLLLTAGSDLDANNSHALLLPVSKEYTLVVRLFLEHNVDADVSDERGAALLLALRCKDMEMELSTTLTFSLSQIPFFA